MHHCICWGLSVQVSGDTTGPSKGHAPTWTHMYNLGSSHKHTHRFSYELLEGKDILMLIAYIIPSTSIQLGRSHKSSVWRSRADQRSETMRLGLGQAAQSRYNNGNSKRDTRRHRTKDSRADPHIPRISRNAFEPLHKGTQISKYRGIVGIVGLTFENTCT